MRHCIYNFIVMRLQLGLLNFIVLGVDTKDSLIVKFHTKKINFCTQRIFLFLSPHKHESIFYTLIFNRELSTINHWDFIGITFLLSIRALEACSPCLFIYIYFFFNIITTKTVIIINLFNPQLKTFLSLSRFRFDSCYAFAVC